MFNSPVDTSSVLIDNRYDQLLSFYKSKCNDENVANVYLPQKMEYVFTHLEDKSEKKKHKKKERIMTYILIGDTKG